MQEYKGVADTLYIPLTARIYVSKRYPEYFYDEKALELENHIPSDSIEKGSSQYSMLASVARYYNFDKVVYKFIEKNNICNIINLGCGLETMAYRLNNNSATFYEIDFPHVIEERSKVLDTLDNEVLIGADILKDDWISEIKDRDIPSLFVVSGVFQYFHEEEVLGLINQIKNRFGDCEILFDAMSKSGLTYANNYVRKTGNKSAMMYFSVDDGNDFARISGTKLIEELKFFKDARVILKNKLNLYSRIAMYMVDKNQGRILHIKIK